MSASPWHPSPRMVVFAVLAMLQAPIARGMDLFGVDVGLPASPVNTPDQFVTEEQTRVRRYFRRTEFPHVGDAPFAPAPW